MAQKPKKSHEGGSNAHGQLRQKIGLGGSRSQAKGGSPDRKRNACPVGGSHSAASSTSFSNRRRTRNQVNARPADGARHNTRRVRPGNGGTSSGGDGKNPDEKGAPARKHGKGPAVGQAGQGRSDGPGGGVAGSASAQPRNSDLKPKAKPAVTRSEAEKRPPFIRANELPAGELFAEFGDELDRRLESIAGEGVLVPLELFKTRKKSGREE